MILRLPAIFCLAVWAFTGLCLARPTLYLIGDSTVRNGTPGQTGWGDPLGDHFDPAKIRVVNRAIGGRSSRTFLTEGRWDVVMELLKPGDFVMMQFGHNDGGPLNGDRCRASIKGVGEESEEIVRETDGKPETVRSYGWYLRHYIAGAKSKGAIPIVLSQVPRNIWKDGKIGRVNRDYGLWAKQAADSSGALFIDFNEILAARYEGMGQEKAAAFFVEGDHTHHSSSGAAFNASVLAETIRGRQDIPLRDGLFPADLWLPAIFSNHMVLQRDLPLPLWGSAPAGQVVTASIAGRSLSATADEDGRWRIELPPLAAGGPFTLEVSAGVTRSFSDVLVGEVWLCAGQSNMDFTLASTPKRSYAGVLNAADEIAAANHPQLRMFTAEWTMHEAPQRDIVGQWAVCTPETAGDFSAVAYYFGLALQEKLEVPVGLVNCSYGASTIEAWIRQATLEAHPQFKGLLSDFSKKRLVFRDNPKISLDYAKALSAWKSGRAPRDPDPVQDQHNPFVLHNGMIAPIAPYGLRGAIWYQGESNLNTRRLYPDLQQALIADWRELWKQAELPFYYVQLASHRAPSDEPSDGQLPEMREAQAKALAIPNTGMAVTIDIGDEKDVHPRNKRDVGLRLSRLALHGTYQKPVIPSGPLFREAAIEQDGIRIHFDHAAGGLVAKGGALQQFAIAGSDRKFVWAHAVIEGESVRVSHPDIKNPAFVRYAWANHPAGANLFNSENLPAAPFRTDS
jgi:sialate O-acetylesterase